MKFTTFNPTDFINLLFETLSLVGTPAMLDTKHDNPPRDLRIAVLKKAAQIWDEPAPLSQIVTGINWDDQAKQEVREQLLKKEFPPDQTNSPIKANYQSDLRATTRTLLAYRKAISAPKELMDGFLCGGGLTKTMDYLDTETRKLQPTINEVDRMLGLLLFPSAGPIEGKQLPELKGIKTIDEKWI